MSALRLVAVGFALVTVMTGLFILLSLLIHGEVEW